jgi:hypothetical protein
MIFWALAGVAVLVLLAVVRLRSRKPVWAWNDVAIALQVGGRYYESHLPEVRAAYASSEGLAFRTDDGDEVFPARWLTPGVVGALGSAFSCSDEVMTERLKSPTWQQVWVGEAGSLRLKPMERPAT